MIENKKGNVTAEIEKNIEESNRNFIKIAESSNTDEKIMLEFFKEKYIHFILYSLFRKKGWNVISEVATELKFTVTGNAPKSGNHDLVVFDNSNRPVAVFEIFLGYDVGERYLKSRGFEDHLMKDYQKLINSSIGRIYILNYFYKGKSERSTPNKSDRKKKAYEKHFSRCVSVCNDLVKKHKESGLDIRLGVWIVEARNDGELGVGVLKIR